MSVWPQEPKKNVCVRTLVEFINIRENNISCRLLNQDYKYIYVKGWFMMEANNIYNRIKKTNPTFRSLLNVPNNIN